MVRIDAFQPADWAHHVDPGIDREGRDRRVTGPPCESGKHSPTGVVQNRRASQIYRFERVAGCGIIGERRGNNAHLHRPWRATSEYAIAAKYRRFPQLARLHPKLSALSP